MNSIGTNGHELKALLQNKLIEPEIIIQQETRLTNNNKNYTIPGYNTLRQDRPNKIKGHPAGGLMTCIKHGIDYQQLDINLQIPGLEVMGITTNIYQNKQTNILNIYIQPQAKITTEHLNCLKPYLTNSVFIGRDLNAHHSSWNNTNKNCPKGITIAQWLETNNLTCINNCEPTWHSIGRNIYSTIDLSIISQDFINDAHYYVHDDSRGSDHFPIFTTLKNTNSETHIVNKYAHNSWNFDKADWNKFSSICANTINTAIINNNIETFNTNFTNKLIEAANQSIPLKKINKLTPVPWWNEEIMEARKTRKKLRKKSKKR